MNHSILKTLLVSTSLLLIAVVYINNNQRNTIASFTNTPTATTICNITDPPIFLGLVGGETWRAAVFRDLCKEFTINEESLQIRIANLKKLDIDVSEELKGLRALRATRFSEEGFVI